MIEFFLKLIYPNVCGLCEKINNEYICNECKLKLDKLDITKIEEYSNRYFSQHAYIYKYDKEIRSLLLNYKFNEKSYLYKTIAKLILENEKICKFMEEFDFIVPVPLHKKKLNQRGYNQCELVLKEVKKNIKGIEFKTNVLIKIKNTVAQSTLSKQEREQNIKQVYKVKDIKNIEGRKILIFDDIYTTGNTANECAKVLMENNAKSVGIFTFAKGLNE